MDKQTLLDHLKELMEKAESGSLAGLLTFQVEIDEEGVFTTPTGIGKVPVQAVLDAVTQLHKELKEASEKTRVMVE